MRRLLVLELGSVLLATHGAGGVPEHLLQLRNSHDVRLCVARH